MFECGDRIRLVTDGDDGLPLVRYGWVGDIELGVRSETATLLVMFDGDLGGHLVPVELVQAVSVATVELCLPGLDLVDSPGLRDGLVAMWRAEAETAGLAVESLRILADAPVERHADHPHEDGSWLLAELRSGAEPYVLRVYRQRGEHDMVRVRADRLAAGWR